jgi:hypothetical protein
MSAHVRVVPVRLREWDERLAVNRSRVIGYRALCRCGWSGGRRSGMREAHRDALAHDCGAHGGAGAAGG